MARRLMPQEPDRLPERLVVPVDPVNEVAILATAIRDTGILDKLLKKLAPDQFLARENREAWAALGEVRRRSLDLDRASVAVVAGDRVADYLSAVAGASEASPNLDWHVENLVWDNARAIAARGPVQSFLDALKDPRSAREKVLAHARQILASFEGHVDRRHHHDPRELVRQQMLEVEKRVAGRAHYPYGIPGLDFYDPVRRDQKRMIPGTAPGLFTCLTSCSSNGKSTAAIQMAIGIAFPDGVESDSPGRKVGYGAWEMDGGMVLEQMACVSLGWSRTDLLDPLGAERLGRRSPILSHEGRVLHEERMHRLSERIFFVRNPFRRKAGEKATNERNLDLLQGLISDLGCHVFFADLWRRVLAPGRERSPEGEEDALERQQVMNAELGVHTIALHQQRLGDVELRADPRPTLEGLKGSKMWAEAPDTVIGFYRPARYKRVPDDKAQGIVLKQRFSVAPLAVEFEWDGDRGRISGGIPIEYDQPGAENSFDQDFNVNVRGKAPPIGRRRAS